MTREEMLDQLNRHGEMFGAVRDGALGGWLGWAVTNDTRNGPVLKMTWRPDDGTGARTDELFRLSNPMPVEAPVWDPLPPPVAAEDPTEPPPAVEEDPPAPVVDPAPAEWPTPRQY